MEIGFTTINSSPVFEIRDRHPNNERIYGAVYSKKDVRYLYPAFHPFINNVLTDLSALRKDLALSASAQAYVDSLLTFEQQQDLVNQTTFPVTPFEHQRVGVAELLHNYRWALQWQMGTGKTKVVIDALQILDKTALILCPRIAINTWVREVDKHTAGTAHIAVIQGAAKATRLRKIQEALKHQYIVTNYDTLRTYGIPRLFAGALAVFKDRGLPPPTTLKKALIQINNAKEQERLAKEWSAGKKTPEIHTEVLELIHGELQWLTDLPFEVLVADESHRIKHIQSQQTKLALELSKKASRRYLLSGTMSQGDPRDLYPQLKFLAPYLIPEDWRKYTERFLSFSPYNKHIVVGYQNIDVINARVSKVSSVRLLDDCVSMPERTFEVETYRLTPELRTAYNYAVNLWEVQPPGSSVTISIEHGAMRLNKLLQICSGFLYVPRSLTVCDSCVHKNQCVIDNIRPGMPRCNLFGTLEVAEGDRDCYLFKDNPKLDALMELLQDLLIYPRSKAIVWAYYREGEMDVIEKALSANNIGYVRVDGSNSGDMNLLAKKFEEDPLCRVYLGQIHTGISVTLNAAQYAIYYGRSWSPEDREQSLFRNYRIGQNSKTIVYDLCAQFSLELFQLRALERKKRLGELLTQRPDCILCPNSAKCETNEIEPWKPGCVFTSKQKREVTKVYSIPEYREDVV